MSTVATIPTVEQSCAFAALVRRGELTVEHRELIANLLDEVGAATRVAAEAGQRHPDSPEFQAIFKAVAWGRTGAEYARLIEAVGSGAQ